MGTRGIWGVVIDGQVKATYNHWDSYPGGLGLTILGWLRGADDREALAVKARALRVVSAESVPTAEDIERLRHYADVQVGTQSLDDWYVLLRRTQGEPGPALDAGVMIDSREFAADSLFCEWGYIVDLDGVRLEVYRGFQHEAHSDGRFADMPKHREADDYWPIRLVEVFPLPDLPDDETFVARCEPAEDAGEVTA